MGAPRHEHEPRGLIVSEQAKGEMELLKQGIDPCCRFATPKDVEALRIELRGK